MFELTPQLIHIFLTACALLCTAGLLGLWYMTSSRKHRELPARTQLLRFKRQLTELEGLMADLEERFTRFQKREGMRTARSAKERTEELTADARALIEQNPPPPAPVGDKKALYNVLRRSQ